MRKYIFIIISMLAIQTVCLANDLMIGTVQVDGKDVKAEYTLIGESQVWVGSGRNACISQYTAGEVVVPGKVTIDGNTYDVTGVSDMAFRLCTTITSITLSEGVTRVGNFAFKGCRNLVKVDLPSTVTSIGTGAFVGLPNLSDFIVKAETPPTWEYNDVFFVHEGGIGDTKAYSTGDIILYVPEGKENVYKNAMFSDEELGWTTPDGWGCFSEIRSVDDQGTETDTLLLYTAADWTNLANLVSQGVTNINAKMMADIKCDENVVVGSGQFPFTGTFDGNGHTLTMTIPGNQFTSGMAPFCHVGTATIKNLIVDGDIISGIHSAGLVGYVDGNATLLVENCRVKAYVNARFNDTNGGHVGGFIGHGGVANVTVRGCLFDGILGQNYQVRYDDSYAAPFIGWCDSTEGMKVEDCYENGSYNSLYKNVSLNYGLNGGTITDDLSITRTYSRNKLNRGRHAHSITCSTERLNMEINQGANVTTYDVSGISFYDTGVMVGDTYYAGDNEQVMFSFNNPGYYIVGVKANDITPTLQGDAPDGSGPYLFTIDPCADYVITAGDETFQYVVLKDDGTDNQDILRGFIDEKTNVQLKGHTLYMDGGWNTLCLPFDMTEEQVKSHFNEGYKMMILDTSSFGDGILTLNFKDTTAVEAGLPFVVKWEPAMASNLSDPVFRDVTISAEVPRTVKIDMESLEVGLKFRGTFNRFDIDGEDHTILYLGYNDKLYHPSAEMSINAFCAYFELCGLIAGKPVNGVNSFVLNFGGGETSIFSIENGELKMKNDPAGWYTLDGRKLSAKPAQKGIYINGGQKVVIK